MTVQPEHGDHLCVSGNRCVDKVDDHARETVKPSTFCDACLRRSADRVNQLPEQWVQLIEMIGDRHAGVDVNIRRPKPGGTVPLNLHVDTLLGNILSALTTAAEVVAEQMNMDDPTEVHQKEPVQTPPWAHSPQQAPLEQMYRCVRIVAPNLTTLTTASGIGGRDTDDPNIDVMDWTPNGLFHMPSTTTGLDLVKRLNHLGSLAYFTLGQARQRTQRDLPCTRCRSRTVGRWAGADHFDCSHCGSQFPEDELRRQDLILLELHRRGLLPQGRA